MIKNSDQVKATLAVVGANLVVMLLYTSVALLVPDEGSDKFNIFLICGILQLLVCLAYAIIHAVLKRTYLAIGFVISIPVILLIGLGVCSGAWPNGF